MILATVTLLSLLCLSSGFSLLPSPTARYRPPQPQQHHAAASAPSRTLSPSPTLLGGGRLESAMASRQIGSRHRSMAARGGATSLHMLEPMTLATMALLGANKVQFRLAILNRIYLMS